MQIIQHQELASSQASITFSSIPTTFTDLVVVYSLRLDAAEDYFGVELNGSASNFTLRSLFGNGSTATSDSRSDGLIGNTANKSTFTSSTFSNGQLYIPNYRSSANKSLSNDTVTENNATEAGQRITALLWSITDPITSITLNAAGANNFVQYSSATLYGIKSGTDGIVTVS
jgi:hypothetical protein